MMDPEYEKRLLRQQNGQVSPYNSVSQILWYHNFILYTNIKKNIKILHICINLGKCQMYI